MRKLFIAIFLLSFAIPSYAFGTMIVAALVAEGFLVAGTVAAMATAMAINMVVAVIVSKAFANNPSFDNGTSGSSPNPGNRQQISPATDNKLPVVYGSAYVGGTVTDLSISSDNQQLYYVLSICEVTNTNSGQTADTITFGNIYYGGKLVTFQSNGYTVASLLDESTGAYDTSVDGRIQIFLYSNGSNTPVNSSQSAISVMQTSGLTYTWDSSKLMSNCAFAIIHLSYSQSAGIRGIEQTKFQVTNSRTNTGDCIQDYLINTRYGCSIPLAQVDATSLAALTTYSNQTFTYTSYTGGTQTQSRFKFNGSLDTTRTVMQNLQDMASCCDCLIKYTEITGLWGVVVQSPTYTVAMDINDSNMISAIQITPLDIANSYNVVECKFPDANNQDAFNSTTFDLATINPSLLYPNEPVNKVSLSFPLTNNSVSAQYLAIRLLKSGREDLQVQVSVNFVGVQLDAGDVVTVTNSNYGWVAKLFRINKVIQAFNDDGSIAVQLNMSEFNPSVYDDYPITQFTPAPNTGIGSPTAFGTLDAPTVTTTNPTATNPNFVVQVRTAPYGITQYAEVWYSAYSNPLTTQMYFAGTSEIQSNGTPWGVYTILPNITLSNIPAGDWYLFSRMVNSLSSSAYSPASTLLQWRPTTFQYSLRYLSVAYATSITGTGFSLSPRSGATYYGLCNQSGTAPSTTPSDYTWYQARVAFGTNEYLLYTNRTGRKFSFDEGFAAYAAGTASFVPTQTATYDPSIWAALPDGTNVIDLDLRTGQLTQTGTTTVGTGQVAITNNPDGTIVSSLQQYLDFGGPYTKTASVATLTIDIYGRVVGFQTPDDFNYTATQYTATSGQTVFTQTRGSGYISGQCLVFRNGLLLDTTEYTDTGGTTGTVTLSTGATSGDKITIIAFRSYNTSTGVYASFTRNTVSLSNQSTYTASGFTFNDGYELLFLNGTIINAQDYNLSGQVLSFIQNVSGDLQVIQWSQNNLGVANGTPVNVDAYTVVGQSNYSFSYNINAFNLYNNGVLQVNGTDYTATSGSLYTLSTAPLVNTNILVQETFARTGAV
jgi:hypothetical protein